MVRIILSDPQKIVWIVTQTSIIITNCPDLTYTFSKIYLGFCTYIKPKVKIMSEVDN